MATSINDVEYVSSFKRSTAISIDMMIVMFFRIVIAQLLGVLWINNTIAKFIADFHEHFGTEVIKNNPEHIEYIIHHFAFREMLFFYFIILSIGLVYHAYLNSSAWQATIGKRVMNIQIVKANHLKIGFGTAVLHYILSILPIIYIIYIFVFLVNNNLTLFHAITHTPFNIFFGFLSIMWIQIHSFTKRKTTMYDLICKVVFIHGKVDTKLPWSKI
ncbi:MAG: hypothetical protein EXR06_00070 [Rickettsiales bacterium]|nr:hypothetical protein [Rickettsiales bacterium]